MYKSTNNNVTFIFSPDRKLEEDISNLQKKMEEIFHKPVDVTVQSPQTLALSPGTIAGIVVLALVLCGLIAFFIYMR